MALVVLTPFLVSCAGPVPRATPLPPLSAAAPAKPDPAPEIISWEQFIADLTEAVKASIPGEGSGKAVAVFPFRNASGRVDALGVALSDETRGALAGSVPLVARQDERFKIVVDEARRATSGMMDERTAPQLGRLLAAQAVLSGSVRGTAGASRIQVSLTSVETGRELLQRPLVGDVALPVSLRDLWGKPYLPELSTGPLGVELLGLAESADGAVSDLLANPKVQGGAAVQFRFRPDADCHAAILWRGTSGQLFPVFPRSSYAQVDLPLKAGRWYRLPQEGHADGEWIAIEGPEGVEEIYFVFSTEPIATIGTLAARVAAGESLEQEGAASLADTLLELGQRSEQAVVLRQEVAAIGAGVTLRDPGAVRPGKTAPVAVTPRPFPLRAQRDPSPPGTASARPMLLSGEGRVVWRLELAHVR